MKRDLEYRYERKFLIKTVSYDWVIHSIKMNSALFKPLYHSRNINNIYFDNDKLDSFHDNVDGIANRQKVRIRWYGDSKGDVSRPVLEIKNRRNSVGAKLAYPLPPMFIGEDINEREIKKLSSSVNENSCVGELNHPIDRSEVDLNEAAIKIVDLKWKGNDVYGKAKVLSTPKGKIIKSLIEDKINL